jgi:hypothetical protein
MGDQQEIRKQKRIKSKREYRNRKRARLAKYKDTLKCELCEERHPQCLEFHHIDPSTKRGNISDLIADYSFDIVMDEITKCRVLCANCHRKEH